MRTAQPDRGSLLEQACGDERPVIDLPDDLLLAGVVLHDVLSKTFKTTPLLTVEEGVDAMRKAQGAGYRRPGG